MSVAIRPAEPFDMALLTEAMHRLSADLGDANATTEAALLEACHGPAPLTRGLIATDGAALAGAALLSPVFSIVRGAPGAYVSDLWVAPGHRGRGLGRRLLAHCAAEGAARWGARFLRLTVHADNAAARAFYTRLGFAHAEQDDTMTLEGPALDALGPA